MFVPAGALASAVTITITRESDNAPSFPPIDVAAIGAMYEILPHGTTFTQPVTVRIPFDASLVPAGATPTLYKADPGGAFHEIPTTVSGTMLVAQVTDFSTFISAAGYPYLEAVYITGANAGIGTVYSFLADAATGTLGPTAQAAYANGSSIVSSAIDRDGRYYYAVTSILGAPVGSPRYSLHQYTLDSDGALVPVVSSSGFNLPADVTGAPAIYVSPTGSSAYMMGGSPDGSILQYAIGADGALTSLSTPTAAGGADPRVMAFVPSGKYAYTTGAGELRQYSVGSDGALASMNTGTAAIVAGTIPTKIVVDPSGMHAYVLNSQFDNSISQYTIGRTGFLGTPGELRLMSTATVSTGPNPIDILMHPSGRYVYVINSGDSTLSQFSVGAGGALVPMNPAAVSMPVVWLAIDLSGQYAYGAASWIDPVILRFRISQGSFSALGTAVTMNAAGTNAYGNMVFAKKPITPGGPNNGIVTSHGGSFFAFSTSSSTTIPQGGTASGAGPFSLHVDTSAFGGWIIGSGIDCDPASTIHTTCFATVASGAWASLKVYPPANGSSYNVTWKGACSGTNFTTGVFMNANKTCLAELIPCTGSACTSR